MSHQVTGKSRGKPPAKLPAQRYKEYEPPELHEVVEMHQEEPLESEGQYATTGPRDQPNHYVQTSRRATTAVKTQDPTDTAIYKPTMSKVFLIALAAVLIICLLVVSLVAVILYSPQVRTSSESAADLLSRIEQLERRVEQLQAIQGTRYSRPSLSQREVGYAEPKPQCQTLAQTSVEHNGAPTAVVDKAKRDKVLLVTLTTTLLLCLLVVSLVAVILYSPQVRTSSESAADLLSRIEQLERRVEQLQATQGTNSTLATLTSLQESQESMEASISRLSTSVNSQINSIQSLSLQNLRQDLDRLRSVNLYQGCIELTESCTMTTGGSTTIYWRSCSAGSLNINPTVSSQTRTCVMIMQT